MVPRVHHAHPKAPRKGGGGVAAGMAPPENREQREGDKGPPIFFPCRLHPLPQHRQVCDPRGTNTSGGNEVSDCVRKITQCGTAPTSSPRPRTDAWRRLECSGGRRCAWRGRLAFAVLARLRRLPSGDQGFILCCFAPIVTT